MGQHIGILEDRMKELSEMKCLTRDYLDEVQRLSKREGQYFMCDIDDTIFSREEQLAQEEILRNNRGNEGNKMIKYHIGLPHFIGKYYKDVPFPQDICSLFHEHNWMFLTAWFPDIQAEKLKALGFEKYPRVVVNEGKEKILAAIRYVIFTLRYIPQEIIIYEDRPEYFIEYRDIIEWILWCKITIMKVEMDGNRGYKKIEEV